MSSKGRGWGGISQDEQNEKKGGGGGEKGFARVNARINKKKNKGCVVW